LEVNCYNNSQFLEEKKKKIETDNLDYKIRTRLFCRQEWHAEHILYKPTHPWYME
jgi:hypothetical protein